MHIVRIYTGEDGESHFEDIDIDFEDHGPIGRISNLWRGKGVIFREVDGELFVDRRKGEQWVPASPSAAKAVLEKSQSACSIAARILPTCGAPKSPDEPKRRLPLSDTEKNAMREFLGL